MQVITELPPGYLSELSKLNELLRLYQVAKKSDKFSQVAEKTKQKINRILYTLRSFSCFEEVEDDVLARVDKIFQEMRSKPASQGSKAPSQKSNSKMSVSSINSINKDSNVGSEKQPASRNPSPIKKSISASIQEPKQKSKSINSKYSESVSFKMPEAENCKSIAEPGKKEIKFEQKKQVRPVISAMEFITPQPPEEREQKDSGLIEISSSEIQTSKKHQSSDNNQQEKDSNVMKESMSSIKSTPAPQNESFFLIDSSSSVDKMEEKEKNEQKPLNEERSSRDQREEDLNSELSSKFSEASYSEDAEDIISKFLTENRDKLNNNLIFNNQLFQQMDKQLDGHFYLFGINKPESLNISELYACTLMKFLTAELYRSESRFEKEFKDFSNNIRVPLGLIFKGAGPQAITPEHVKFLLTLQSPFPVILVLKNDDGQEGWICSFSDSIIEGIRITPRKQLGQFSQQLQKKINVLEYSQEHYPKDKNKVMTKYLPREIPIFPEQAPNAITISGNECIREEKHCFTFKLHSKYMNQMKNSQYFIYYVNNNIANARTLFAQKEFQNFKKQVLENEPKVPMILGFAVTKDSLPIKRQFFEVLLESKGRRDPFFFINFVALTGKKTVVAILKQEVTMEMIRNIEVLPYRDFQKDTPLTHCIHVISKNNIKQFQTEGKEEVVNVAQK